jgi:U3 small nucleolar RNA-associated protein 12
VTRLCAAKDRIAVGYADGNIQIFDLKSAEVDCVFAGHKTAITALRFDDSGHHLFSGSQVLERKILLFI